MVAAERSETLDALRDEADSDPEPGIDGAIDVALASLTSAIIRLVHLVDARRAFLDSDAADA